MTRARVVTLGNYAPTTSSSTTQGLLLRPAILSQTQTPPTSLPHYAGLDLDKSCGLHINEIKAALLENKVASYVKHLVGIDVKKDFKKDRPALIAFAKMVFKLMDVNLNGMIDPGEFDHSLATFKC